MVTHTHRVHVTFLQWLEEQKNVPDRTDHYIMQVAAEVRRSNVEKPSDVKLEDMFIPFVARAEPEQEEQARPHQHAWFAALGMPVPENFTGG